MSDGPKAVFQKPAEPYEPRGRLDPEGFDRHVQFRLVPPPGDLSVFIEHCWVIRWDVAAGAYESREVMHRPYVDLFVSEGWSGIQGTFRGTRTYEAKGNGRILGVRFRPAAFHAFWPGKMSALADSVMELRKAFAWGDDAGVAQLLELDDDGAIAALLERLRASHPKEDKAITAINEIISAIERRDDLQTVGAVAAAFDKSERWLQQAFRDALGIGLKWLLQRKRLLAAAEEIRETDAPDWAGMAYELGYSSQQHFITDFKTVLGETPLQYKNGLAKPQKTAPRVGKRST